MTALNEGVKFDTAFPFQTVPLKILDVSKFFPCKSNENPRWCLQLPTWSKNDMQSHVKTFKPSVCLCNKCFYLFSSHSHTCPNLLQIFPNNSWFLPRSFPHLSQIIPSFAPCPYSFPGVCRGFPIVFSFFSQGFPKSFPILPPNVASAPQGFCLHCFLAYSQGSPRSFFDLITRQALNQLFFTKAVTGKIVSLEIRFFPLQKNPGFHCDFTGANTS